MIRIVPNQEKNFIFVMFQERYIIENRFRMVVKISDHDRRIEKLDPVIKKQMILTCYKPVTYPFNGNDLQRGIFF